MKTIAAIAHQKSSPFRGVSFHRTARHPWQSQIKHGGRSVHLGLYATPEEAARVYDAKAREWQGASAILNFPDERCDVPIIQRKPGISPQFSHILTPDFLRREYVEAGRTTHEIGKALGVDALTVANYLRVAGLPLRKREAWRIYDEPTNLDGFVAPSSDWHAYWLGFIAADGCVFTADGRRRHNVVRIQLKSDDAPHLEEFRRGLGTAVTVKTANGKSSITLHSRRFVDILSAWGIVQKKSLTLAFPPIPDSFIGAFIRGYFDGDGTIYWRHRAGNPQPVCRFISGSTAFLSALEMRLQAHGIDTSKIYRSGGNAHHLPTRSRRNNLKRFASFIYQNSSVHLPRKALAFQPITEGV